MAERLHGIRVKIGGSLFQSGVHAMQPGPYGQVGERQAEDRMGDHDIADTKFQPDQAEKRKQGHGGDNLGHHER